MLVVNVGCRFGLLLMAGLLSGCADTVPIVDYYDVDTESLERYASMQVVNQSAIDSGEFYFTEEIEGLYCRKDARSDDVMSREAKKIAIDQVKLKAAREGADAISEPRCTPNIHGSFGNNCMSTLVCMSMALKAGKD